MELLEAAKIGAKWMRWWFDHQECECEIDHRCGRNEREQELKDIEAAIVRAQIERGEPKSCT